MTPPPDEVTPPATNASTDADAPVPESTGPVTADAEAPDTEPEDDEDDPFPPSLIVRTRAPDRGASKIIGDLSPAQARLGTTVGFGITPAGREAEYLAQSQAQPRADAAKAPANPHTLPNPRLQSRPTRVATSTRFDGTNPDD
ncbi:MAG: hypothetical protein AB1Z98_35840 [Nannocystaceae bacterium]